ncbi:unnamed protein product [Periconia digitata]|uniref:Uncharacterized protein n=1 Tax=Periconia digitata TaxID=1303443 RepID=A0A9W4UCX8_9PLEO|nr:unnamed protein product [Periconia digitata]
MATDAFDGAFMSAAVPYGMLDCYADDEQGTASGSIGNNDTDGEAAADTAGIAVCDEVNGGLAPHSQDHVVAGLRQEIAELQALLYARSGGTLPTNDLGTPQYNDFQHSENEYLVTGSELDFQSEGPIQATVSMGDLELSNYDRAFEYSLANSSPVSSINDGQFPLPNYPDPFLDQPSPYPSLSGLHASSYTPLDMAGQQDDSSGVQSPASMRTPLDSLGRHHAYSEGLSPASMCTPLDSLGQHHDSSESTSPASKKTKKKPKSQPSKTPATRKSRASGTKSTPKSRRKRSSTLDKEATPKAPTTPSPVYDHLSPQIDADGLTTPDASDDATVQDTPRKSTKRRTRQSNDSQSSSPTKRTRKTESRALPPFHEVNHLLPNRPMGTIAQLWSNELSEEQRVFNQAALLTTDPETRGRPLADLMHEQFQDLSPGEKARLLLPILNGMDPLEEDETDEEARDLSEKLGIGYGAARERIACMKAHRKTMSEEAAQWEKVIMEEQH